MFDIEKVKKQCVEYENGEIHLLDVDGIEDNPRLYWELLREVAKFQQPIKCLYFNQNIQAWGAFTDEYYARHLPHRYHKIIVHDPSEFLTPTIDENALFVFLGEGEANECI